MHSPEARKVNAYLAIAIIVALAVGAYILISHVINATAQGAAVHQSDITSYENTN